jgi:hypothetical protein
MVSSRRGSPTLRRRESAADAVRSYEAPVVAGLLQTEGYARAMTEGGRPDLDGAEVEKPVRVRMNRQSLLSRMTRSISGSCWTKRSCTVRSEGGGR